MNLAFQNVLLRNYLTMKNTSRFGVIGEEVGEGVWLRCGHWKLWIIGVCPPSEIKNNLRYRGQNLNNLSKNFSCWIGVMCEV